MIHTTLGNFRFRFWRQPSDVLLRQLSMRDRVCIQPVGVFLFSLSLGAGGQAWSGLTAALPGGPVGIPGGRAHRPRQIAAMGEGRDATQATGGVAPRPGPEVRGTASRGRARSALPASATGRRRIRAQAHRLWVPGGRTHLSGNEGGAAGP